MSDLLPPNNPRPPITEASARTASDRTARLAMRTRTFTASTMTECLQQAKQEMGLDAMIVSKRTFRQGALFGRWGGRPMVEVTFGTYKPSAAPAPASGRGAIFSSSSAQAAAPVPGPDMQQLEARMASLADSVQTLIETGSTSARPNPSPFVSAPVEAKGLSSPAPISVSTISAPAAPPDSPARTVLGRRTVRRAPEPAPAAPAPTERYPALMRQLLDAEVAAPLARQLVAALPDGLQSGDAASDMRTLISQRLRIANRLQLLPQTDMHLLAFVGTTGVGKTTTIAKLSAQFALVERRRVGVITLDTNRIAAAQQLQTYGQILRVPVQVAHDKLELMQRLADFRQAGTEVVLIDTAGRSPNDMLPLGETGHLFEDVGPMQKFLAAPATLAARDLENIVARFQGIMAPDALILTKLDEASDNACFGRLLTMQAKFGLPLAYVTTGQKVPDDIMFPDSHAIAARILTLATL